jgi:hypothetical protein
MLRFSGSVPLVFWETKIPELIYVGVVGDSVVAVTFSDILLLSPRTGEILHRIWHPSFFFESPIDFASYGKNIRVRSEWNTDIMVSRKGRYVKKFGYEIDTKIGVNWVFEAVHSPCLVFPRERTEEIASDGGSVWLLSALNSKAEVVWVLEERDYFPGIEGEPLDGVFPVDYRLWDLGGRTIVNIAGAVICFECLCGSLVTPNN